MISPDIKRFCFPNPCDGCRDQQLSNCTFARLRRRWPRDAAVRWADEQKRWELERRNFQREREQWASQRSAQEDRYRLDAGNTLGVFWERIESHHCVGHGTREYTAVVGFNADNACQHMPITVNGRMFAVPQECRREGDMVVSRWNVNVGEASCKLYWSDLSDKVCSWPTLTTISLLQRFEAHLLGLDRGMDGMNMCRSTPIDIRGQHFDQPGECQDKVRCDTESQLPLCLSNGLALGLDHLRILGNLRLGLSLMNR
ncbi:hypothetical protein FOMPIDRAFT_1132622 [Fomitopsis schrenkii]|uniref:Uncharacterized protein n=1 Tax=Fomitopsis schrenkii TaxID=2126942 RepID=S8DW01_FOMSC|nr:hypothetical protein FOMPIDRAFT_1132622 [Fomitopsis schrenkii]